MRNIFISFVYNIHKSLQEIPFQYFTANIRFNIALQIFFKIYL